MLKDQIYKEDIPNKKLCCKLFITNIYNKTFRKYEENRNK